MKPWIRQIGFDDGFFRKSDPETVLVGTVVRGNDLVEGFLVDRIPVDGDNATDLVSRLVKGSKFYDTLRVIFLKGLTLAGFNVVDIKALSESTGLPVIVVLRKEPDMDKIRNALRNVPNPQEKLARMKKAGRIYEMKRVRGRLLFQKAGISKSEAKEILEASIRTGNIPESARISHLVASALTLGESRRRA